MSSPHDALFKATFSQLEHARSALESVLPTALARAVDWSTLALVSSEHPDGVESPTRSDLLFTAQVDTVETCFYLLYEHQSSVDPRMPLRLLGYMTRIWERFAKESRAKLPPIVPVVLHHSDTGWTATTRFHDLIDTPPSVAANIAAFIPDFEFVLDDLHALDDAALRERALTALSRITFVALQRCRGADDPAAILRPWFDTLVSVITAPNGAATLYTLARYILVASEAKPAEVRAFFRELGSPAEEAFVTAAEKLTAEARERALAQGRAEGEATLLLKLLGRRFGPLSLDTRARVENACTSQLETWAERLLAAETLDQVLLP